MAQDGPNPVTNLTLAPLESPLRRGFLVPPNGVRGSHCGAAAFEALSCGRGRVRWPVPLAAAVAGAASGRAGRAWDTGSGRLARAAPTCHSAEEYDMDEITLYQWVVLGFLALIAVLIWRVLLAVEAVENTLKDSGSPAS